MSTITPLILASASPRRVQMLAQIGIVPDTIVSPNIDETPMRAEPPCDHARRLAMGKAAVVEAPGVVLAADTVVALGRRILPKAETEADVRACLTLLSGRTHRVYTAVAVRHADGRTTHRVVETRLAFKRLSAFEIDNYIASGEGLGKAGGYAIQGRAGAFVIRLIGSYSAVVGLPLYETTCLLNGAGVISPAPQS